MFRGADAESRRWISRYWSKQAGDQNIGVHIKSSWPRTWKEKQKKKSMLLNFTDTEAIVVQSLWDLGEDVLPALLCAYME